ncbi:MAG TPA: hypothetical protein VN667_13560 [Burkholderiales bacterium]|nr:hypothetical protein [Burkholderiales bacterium]
MPLTNLDLAVQLIFVLCLWFFLIIGALGFATGAGLMLDPPLMQWVSAVMNRWVSLRRPTKWANVPRYVEATVRRHRRTIGVIFVLTAAISLLGLIARVDAHSLAAEFGRGASGEMVDWIAQSVYWMLIAGSLLAIATGIMLVAAPHALQRIETQANRWYSFRHVSLGADAMHFDLDVLVARFPRVSGLAIVLMALVDMIECAIGLRAIG